MSRCIPAVGRSALLLALAAIVLGGCGSAGTATPQASPSSSPAPSATCGGIEIQLDGALPCDRIVAIALETLGRRTPEQLARGITSVEAVLGNCPRGEMPPQIDCTGSDFAQQVTVSFGPSPAGGPIEPSLTVAIDPVSGSVLGIVNPLIR